jgi:hypothetical protein
MQGLHMKSMQTSLPVRGDNEIAHGRMLAREDPELILGWGTPAGRLRAARHGALITRTLREVGFVEVSIRQFDWLHPSMPRPLIALVRALGAVLERLPLAREFAGSLCLRAVRV